jgi:hypothetical protein
VSKFFNSDFSLFDDNVFVIMPYDVEKDIIEIEEAVRDALNPLKPFFAKIIKKVN